MRNSKIEIDFDKSGLFPPINSTSLNWRCKHTLEKLFSSCPDQMCKITHQLRFAGNTRFLPHMWVESQRKRKDESIPIYRMSFIKYTESSEWIKTMSLIIPMLSYRPTAWRPIATYFYLAMEVGRYHGHILEMIIIRNLVTYGNGYNNSWWH